MINNKTVHAFTFARSGSKGVKGKNIKKLNGTPLLVYPAKQALENKYIDTYLVSTDGQEIAQVAQSCGAQTLMRPEELATDTANEWDAWQHAVKTQIDAGKMGLDDLFISLPATAPLRGQQDINGALESFIAQSCDLLITITEASSNPFFNMVCRDPDGKMSIVNQCTTITRRQDAPAVFDIATVAYVTTPAFILKASGVMEGNTGGFFVEKERALDIDTELDFKFAEFLLSQKRSPNE